MFLTLLYLIVKTIQKLNSATLGPEPSCYPVHCDNTEIYYFLLIGIVPLSDGLPPVATVPLVVFSSFFFILKKRKATNATTTTIPTIILVSILSPPLLIYLVKKTQ